MIILVETSNKIQDFLMCATKEQHINFKEYRVARDIFTLESYRTFSIVLINSLPLISYIFCIFFYSPFSMIKCSEFIIYCCLYLLYSIIWKCNKGLTTIFASIACTYYWDDFRDYFFGYLMLPKFCPMMDFIDFSPTSRAK